MSNTASSHLHLLIRSLDKSEKRYFKLHIRRMGEERNVHYEKLFDALSKQDQYDEEAIIKKFKGESFVKRFSVTKNRLYNQLLNALEAFHANSNIRVKLQRNLHQVEILFGKRLLKQSSKILASVEKVAIEQELYSILIQVQEWKLRMHERSGFDLLEEEDREGVLESVQGLDQGIHNELEARVLKAGLFEQLYQKGKVRKEERLPSLEETEQRLIELESKAGLGAHTLHHLYHARSVLSFMRNEHEASLSWSKKDIDFIRSRPDIQWSPDLLPRLLSNAIYGASRLRRKEEARRHLEDLRVEVRKMEESAGLALLRSTELAYFHMNDRMEEGKEVLLDITEALDQGRIHLSERDKAGLHFSMACIQLSTGDSRDALYSLNDILNSLRIGQSEDIYCFAQMLHLLAHIDLDNRDYLKYALKSTRRQLENRGRILEWEEFLVDLVQALVKSRSKETDLLAYSKFVNRTREVRKTDSTRATFEYFDFLAWAENKLSLLSASSRLSA